MKGAPPYPPRRRESGPAASGLGEADPTFARLDRRLQVGKGHGLEGTAEPGDRHGGRPHEPPARIAVIHGLPGIVELGPGGQEVGEAEPVGQPKFLQVIDHIRGRLVVVGEPGVERHPGPTADGFGRNPRKRSDRTCNPHTITLNRCQAPCHCL